jgi:hypothetical protein
MNRARVVPLVLAVGLFGVVVATLWDDGRNDRASAPTASSAPKTWSISTRPPDVPSVQSQAQSTLYYLGDSFEGLPLVHAEGFQGRALFVYGTCDVPVGQVDGGCSPPLQLQEEATPVAGPLGCSPRPGRPRPYEHDPSATIVFAGSTMIKIYANDPARGRRAAHALEPVGEPC